MASAVRMEINKLSAVLALQALPVPRLFQRHDESQGMLTWMEVYSDVDQCFVSELNRTLANTDLLNLLASERHVEIFTEVDFD